MAVKVTGVEQMIVDIRKRVKDVSDKQGERALKAGAEIVYKNMQSGMAYFKDTGATLEEMKISSVSTSRGEIKLRIFWQGPRNRFRIIHLNEKGYTRNGKFYSPRGRGAIARSLARSESPYYDTIRLVMSRG